MIREQISTSRNPQGKMVPETFHIHIGIIRIPELSLGEATSASAFSRKRKVTSPIWIRNRAIIIRVAERESQGDISGRGFCGYQFKGDSISNLHLA